MSERDSATANGSGLPRDCDQLLTLLGEQRTPIYHLVRQILDDLEQAAPWDDLYYPPPAAEDFLRMTNLLVAVIEGIPQRVDQLATEIEALGADEEFLGDFEFFFRGIHFSVEQEISKLRRLLETFQSELEGREPTEDERDYISELSADLKGKYSSSIMGASASLLAADQWRGVEIEPILYPEKLEEFARNEKLVETLSEVTENIHNLLEQVPLAHCVETWSESKRVDQYALTPLYNLLGNLGKLMREDSRRALYSGDYHQIQKRENLLSARVNELTSLHSMTWGTMPPGVGGSAEDAYPKMIRKATELAAVLNVDILKQIIGDKQVESIMHVVAAEKEANANVDRWRFGHEIKPHPSRQRIPETYHSLIILLYDEDLNTFLELLLGSVLKRASLTVQKEIETPPPEEIDQLLESIQVLQPDEIDAEPPPPPAASAPPPDLGIEMPEIDLSVLDIAEPTPRTATDLTPLRESRERWDSSSLDSELQSLSGPAFAPDPSSMVETGPDLGDELDADDPADDAADRQALLNAMSDVEAVLGRLRSRSSSTYKSFQLIRRLLKQKRTIPPAMLQSMQPYLYEVMNELLPRLGDDRVAAHLGTDTTQLIADCQLLCRPQLGPNELSAD
ncbi:MAG: hypothetical protein AAGE94_04415, partial [Acidobacteriota bacterium]